MLPDALQWTQQVIITRPTDTHFLYCGDKAVARVSRTIYGQWYTCVNCHLEAGKARYANCANLEQGKRWIERWAAHKVNRPRLYDALRPGYTSTR